MKWQRPKEIRKMWKMPNLREKWAKKVWRRKIGRQIKPEEKEAKFKVNNSKRRKRRRKVKTSTSSARDAAIMSEVSWVWVLFWWVAFKKLSTSAKRGGKREKKGERGSYPLMTGDVCAFVCLSLVQSGFDREEKSRHFFSSLSLACFSRLLKEKLYQDQPWGQRMGKINNYKKKCKNIEKKSFEKIFATNLVCKKYRNPARNRKIHLF